MERHCDEYDPSAERSRGTPRRIRVTVEGGIVQAVDFIPPGIVVEV